MYIQVNAEYCRASVSKLNTGENRVSNVAEVTVASFPGLREGPVSGLGMRLRYVTVAVHTCSS